MILEGSNNPEYNDHKDFPVPMAADLDKYLKSQVKYIIFYLMKCFKNPHCHYYESLYSAIQMIKPLQE